jgi:glycosyltransferase involved in cell wall biosynthesis
LRILFVLTNYFPYIGGGELLFQRLAEGIAARGHQVTVLTSFLPGAPMSETVNGVAIRRVPKLVRPGVPYPIACLPYVVSHAGRHDLIHTAYNTCAAPAFLARLVRHRPLVFTAFDVLGEYWDVIDGSWLKARYHRAIERLLLALPYDRYVSISEWTQRRSIAARVPPHRTRMLLPGIDEVFQNTALQPDGSLRAKIGADREEFVYAYYGRPGRIKGVEYLVRAAPEIQRAIPSAHLALILSREPADRYRYIAEMVRGLEGCRVHLVPSAPDTGQLIRYLVDANCIVIPSLSEGFGLTTAETAALGVPIVASRVGAIPEVISGRYTLVEPGNSGAIADAVVRAAHGDFDAADPRKNFRWDEMIEGYLSLYRELVPACT